MPYSNIVWVKFKLELLSDYRFTDQLNDSQKLLYLGLLLLAGESRNSIPSDENYIKRRLNLCEKAEDIKNDIQHIVSVFKKITVSDNLLSFNNFRELHNWTEGKKKEKNRKKIGNKRELPEQEEEKEEEQEKEQKKNSASHETDSAFLETVRKTYDYVDLDSELKKMDGWLLAHPGRKLTRRFIINWLNKIDKPIKTKPQPQVNKRSKYNPFDEWAKEAEREKSLCKPQNV